MKTAHRIMFALALLLCLPYAGADSLSQVDIKDIQDYWMLDQGQMAPTLPVDISRLSRQYEGQLRFSYELTINEDGRPVDFKWMSISPEGAEVEAAGLRRFQLFKRYRPGPKNPEGKPVRVIANDIRIWNPAVHERDPE